MENKQIIVGVVLPIIAILGISAFILKLDHNAKQHEINKILANQCIPGANNEK